MKRRAFFTRAGAGASLAVLAPNELIEWHDAEIAADLDAERRRARGDFPVEFELLDNRANLVHATTCDFFGDGAAVEGKPPTTRAFRCVVRCWKATHVAVLRYRIADGGLAESAGWRSHWVHVRLAAGDSIEYTATVGFSAWGAIS